MTILAETAPLPDEPLPDTEALPTPPQETIADTANPPVPATLASSTTAFIGVWVYIDHKSTRQNGDLNREPCYHDRHMTMYFDADELGEWDDIPNRAIVCLGCEAVRWL